MNKLALKSASFWTRVTMTIHRRLALLAALVCLLGSATAGAVSAWLSVPAVDYNGTFTASWNFNPGPNQGGYTRLLQRVNGGSWMVLVQKGFGNQSHAVTVSAGGNYEFKLSHGYMPQNPCGGPGCNPQLITGETAIKTTVVTLTSPTNTPTLSLPATDNDGNYTVSWNAVSGATTYQLQQKIGTGSWVTAQNTSATSKDYSGQLSNTYYYRVRSCNPNGCSVYSAEKTTEVVLPNEAVIPKGFNSNYEVRQGDINGDSLKDLYVRQRPDVTGPSPVTEFVLRRVPNGQFALISGLTSSQKSQAGQWPTADVELDLGDINIDGTTDLIIKGIGDLSGFDNALDQILFAETDSTNQPPMHIKEIDNNVRGFFRDLSEMVERPFYHIETVIENGWFHIEEGDVVTAFWSIDYLKFWGFCWFDCTVKAEDTDQDDIFDRNATPDLCLTFSCDWIGDHWYAWVTAQELELVIEFERFNQAALNLQDVVEGIISDGELQCGSPEANAISNAFVSTLGIELGGGRISRCEFLGSESDFNPATIGITRLGMFSSYIRNMDSKLSPRSDHGDPDENQADLENALEYLGQSPTFTELWNKFEELGLKVIVHRKAPDGSIFNPDRPDVVIWDPDFGLIIENGIASPASGLAHEVAHAVRYHTDREGYFKDDVWEPTTIEIIVDGEIPNIVTSYTPSKEEERAAQVEATIQEELGEPTRINYMDGTRPPGDIEIGNPTFSCHRGNQDCDSLINNQ